jgi:AbrB family looped-hinge helix DNA binding protein
MKAIAARVSSRYQVIIPKEVRETLRLQPYDTILFLIEDESIHIRPKPANFTEALRGLHRHVWQQDPAAWLEEERDAWT